MPQTAQPDFKSLFESAPGLYLILLPDLTIVAVSDAYLNATMTKRNEILGKNLFEAFPDNPNDPTATGVSNLRASLNYVLQNKTTHTMAVQKYDIRRPDGTFEERYWSPLNKAVLNKKKEIDWIIHRVEDVTEFIRLKKEELIQIEVTKDLKRQVQDMEMEIYKRAQEIQLANKFLLQEVKERKKLEKHLEEFNERLEEQVKIKTDKLIATLTQQKESEEKYKMLFYKSPLPKWIYDLETLRFLEVNEMAVKHYGYTEKEFLSMTLKDIRPKEDIELLLKDHKEIQPGPVTRHGIWRHLKKNGELIIVETTAHAINYNGIPARMVVAHDITEKIKYEKQLADERNLLRSLIDNLPSFIYIKDLSSRYVIANNTLVDLVGAASEKEIIGKTVLDLFGPEIALVNFEEDKIVFEKGEIVIDREESIISKDGNKIWLLTSKVPLKDKDNKIIGLIGISRDITERKQDEEKIQQMNEELRSLSAHLINVREEERARIAREIHDELGQQITGLKMDISWIRKKISVENNFPVKEKLNEMSDLLDDTVHTVRKISSELRPSLLDDIGLVAALDWQSKEFNKRFDIPVQFKSQEAELHLDASIATGLFRIYQETLTNVARHAHANHVESRLDVVDEKIILTIKDDGKGFDPSTKNKKTLGLLGMKERAILINGSLKIISEPGRGTTVIVSVPAKT